MRTSFRFSRHPIGIDLGLYGARMLQLDARVAEPNRPRVAAAARMAWPEEVRQEVETGRTPPVELVAPLLLKMANRGQFRGRDVAIALPREMVRVKNLRLPTMPPDEAIAAATIDAREVFGVGGPDAANVQVFPAGEVRQGNETRLEFIAACANAAEVDGLVERWHAAGLRPASIDLECAALYRSVERFVRRKDDEAEVNVLVEIGQRRTQVLIGRGRDLSFFKAIEIGGAQLTKAVARKLSLDIADTLVLRRRLAATQASHAAPDPARTAEGDPVRQAVVDGLRPIVEELSRELALCLRYYSVNFRGQRPARVRIVGGESSDPTVLRLLEKSLPVPVDAQPPVANADCSAMSAADRSAGALGDWTLAFGLALKSTRGPFADLTGPTRAAVAAAPAVPVLPAAAAAAAVAEPEVARA